MNREQSMIETLREGMRSLREENTTLEARIAELEQALIVSDRIKDRLCDLVGAPGNPMEAINLLVYRSGVCEWTETGTACGVEFDGDDIAAEFCSSCGRKIQVNGTSSPEGGEG